MVMSATCQLWRHQKAFCHPHALLLLKVIRVYIGLTATFGPGSNQGEKKLHCIWSNQDPASSLCGECRRQHIGYEHSTCLIHTSGSVSNFNLQAGQTFGLSPNLISCMIRDRFAEVLRVHFATLESAQQAELLRVSTSGTETFRQFHCFSGNELSQVDRGLVTDHLQMI